MMLIAFGLIFQRIHQDLEVGCSKLGISFLSHYGRQVAPGTIDDLPTSIWFHQIFNVYRHRITHEESSPIFS